MIVKLWRLRLLLFFAAADLAARSAFGFGLGAEAGGPEVGGVERVVMAAEQNQSGGVDVAEAYAIVIETDSQLVGARLCESLSQISPKPKPMSCAMLPAASFSLC